MSRPKGSPNKITSARNGSQLWYEEIKLYTYSTILDIMADSD